MNLFCGLFAVLLLSGCGIKLKAKQETSQNPQKEEPRCLCLGNVDYTLLSFRAFPEKMAIKMNERLVLDECRTDMPDVPHVNRGQASGKVTGKVAGSFERSLKLEIIDRGEDCRNDAIFYSSDAAWKQVEVVRKHGRLPQIEKALIKIYHE